MTGTSLITSLFEAITEGITGIISPIVEGIKTGFTTLVSDTSGETSTISLIGYFLFAMLGLSIGVGLVWLVISLFKRRG